MLDLNHSCFSAKVMLLRDYFDSETTFGKMLNVALDTFTIDTGTWWPSHEGMVQTSVGTLHLPECENPREIHKTFPSNQGG